MVAGDKGSSEFDLVAFVADAQTETLMKGFPLKELGFKPLIQKGEMDAAYNYLKTNASPRLLILDLSTSSLPISDIQKIAEVCDPSVKVIAIGDSNDIGIFRKLLTVGVSDYLAKPVSQNLMVKSIQDVFQGKDARSPEGGFSSAGHVISFLGARGGVGTSTIAANCCFEIAEVHTKRTCLVDLNLKAGVASQFFDLLPTGSFQEILEEPGKMDEVLVERLISKYESRLGILSSEAELFHETLDAPESLRDLLKILSMRYNYTVFDLPWNDCPGMQQVALNASDTIVIVCDLTLPSVKRTAKLVDYFRAKQNLQQRLLILANNHKLYKEGEFPLKDFEDAIQSQVSYVLHFDHVLPLEAFNRGVPLMKEKGYLPKQIREFTTLLLGRPLEQSKSFLSSLFGGH